MLPPSQFVILVILILLALVLLQWEGSHPQTGSDDLPDESSHSDQRLTGHDQNRLSS
ncbi:MAG: hypothetical protein KJZ93_05015 [Caldilineaceae bacterium]|nr:hypothetical protein [Caldilineaceae bacterium]